MKATTAYLNSIAETDWIIRDVIPRDSQITIFGKPGIGKSLLALQLAITMSHAEPVVYLDYEMSANMLRDRLDAFQQPAAVDNGLNYHLFAASDVGPLDTAQGSETLGALLAAYQSKILIIDAMAGAVEGGENDNDTYRRFTTHTVDRMREYGVTTIRIDHLSIKADQHAGPRGASRKIDDVDVAWEFQTVGTTGHYVLKNRKNRIGVAPLQVPVRKHATPLGFTVGTEITMDVLSDKELAALEAADQLHLPVDISRNTLKKELAGTGLGTLRAASLQKVVTVRKTRGGTGLGTHNKGVPSPLGNNSTPPGVECSQGDSGAEEVERPDPY